MAGRHADNTVDVSTSTRSWGTVTTSSTRVMDSAVRPTSARAAAITAATTLRQYGRA